MKKIGNYRVESPIKLCSNSNSQKEEEKRIKKQEKKTKN